MSVVRKGRGRPVTVFAGGEGRSVPEVERLSRGVKGSSVFFEYERSGHGELIQGIRRQADRDALELGAVAEEYGATRVLGSSRGARAAVGALLKDAGRFEGVVLVLPPGGWAAGDYVSWVGNDRVIPDQVVRPGAEVLVVAQLGDRGHPVRLAEQWAGRWMRAWKCFRPVASWSPW
jgi:pimeloyl-ACP methyl ester carboxylesterase